MKTIQAESKCLQEVLDGQRFNIDYYQREYRWGTKQVVDMLTDLGDRFLNSHDQNNDLESVRSEYEGYFFGSIIISSVDGKYYIVDGQQRLTTLTLLLIYIMHQLKEKNYESSHVESLISKYIPPRQAFVLDVDEREQCMEALFNETSNFDTSQENESIQNIMSRYQDIVDNFPNEITDNAIEHFSAWLIYNVDVIIIDTSSDSDAYTIFETMNDRGLSLTSTDMLKGYLLTNITEQESRNKANEIWRERVNELRNIGKEEDSDAIKAWLRSQYATTVRERKRDSEDQDFELIASQSHRWVKDNANKLGLIDKNSQSYFNFISENFKFYTKWYMFLIDKAKNFSNDFPNVYYNAQNNFSLQYPVILAPLNHDNIQKDTEDDIFNKIKVTSIYLDIVLARRIWNNRAIDYATMKHNMYKSIILPIRNMSYNELIEFFTNELKQESEQFNSNNSLQLNKQNRKKIHRILARITDYIQMSDGSEPRYVEYTERKENPYEIEHIWANKYIEHGHKKDFNTEHEFFEYRNRIGGLLLLPKKSNASYSDKPYNEKVEHYQKNELLASSLHHSTYSNNPAFKDFIRSTGLNLKAYSKFEKSELDQRQDLYLRVAEKIWSPDNLKSD